MILGLISSYLGLKLTYHVFVEASWIRTCARSHGNTPIFPVCHPTSNKGNEREKSCTNYEKCIGCLNRRDVFTTRSQHNFFSLALFGAHSVIPRENEG